MRHSERQAKQKKRYKYILNAIDLTLLYILLNIFIFSTLKSKIIDFDVICMWRHDGVILTIQKRLVEDPVESHGGVSLCACS